MSSLWLAQSKVIAVLDLGSRIRGTNAGMTFRFVGDNATVSETGTISSDIQNTDNLTMKLSTRPTGNVVIDLTSSDTGEFTISPSQMTFTTSNWSTDQIMTVTGQTDGIEDGTVQVFARANINTAGTTMFFFV